MQQRRGTAAQWISTNSGNGPVLNPGEIGFETDTGKFKIGDGVTPWLNLSYFADVDTLGSALDGDFVELADIGAASGVAGLDSNKNLIVPGASVIIEGATPDSYEMTITATDPTQDRTITLPDATGTVALTSDIPSLTGYVTETGNQTLTNKSIDLANNTVSGTVAEFNTALSDANFVTTTDSGTVTSTMIANETIVDGDIANNAAIAQSKISGLTTDLSNKQDKVSGVSDTEIGYLDGVTSNVQAQLDSKLSSATASSTYQPLVSGVSNTEIGYLDGVTSNVQAQLDTKLDSSTAASTYAPLASPTFTGTVTLPSGTVTSAMIADETIVNADIANTAAIAQSKIANLTTDLAAKADLSGAAFTGNVSTTANLTVDGNFTVNGSNVLVSATQIQIEDSLIQLGHQNPANTVDLGFVAGYNDGSDKHSGLVKDATDAKWKLFKGVTTEPATTVDFSQATLDDLVVGALEASSLTVGSVSNTEISYLDGVTSNIQAQLDSKLSSATASSTYQPLVSGVSNTEIGYLDGVTSNVQAQLDSKAPLASPTFTGTVTLPTGTVTSGMILDGTIVNGDISNTAGIALSKLASGTSGQIIVANSSGVPTWVSETGDITISDTGVTAIASGVIVNADISASAAIDKTKISGNAITAADTATVTNTMLAGSIANNKLANSSVTINGESVALGGTVTISAAPTPSTVSSNVVAQANYNYFVDTTAARTITLPSSPSLGDTISIWDASGSAATNNITVARNGNKINGLTEDALIDVNQASSFFVYTGNTIGWKFD